MLSQDELNRYARQLNLPQWSAQEQLAMKNAKVLVVGAGALGAPLIAYLPVMGIGTIGLVDDDTIEIHNLHRQFIFRESDIGQKKVSVAKNFILERNSSCKVETFSTRLSPENIHEIADRFDIIVDGTDNFPTRYLINDYCVLYGKINVHGSIDQFNGQVAVFNAPNGDQRSGNYRDLYPSPPSPTEVLSCEEGGVLGPLPGIVASTIAIEIVKLITGIGSPLVNSFLRIDTLQHQYLKLSYESNPDNPLLDEAFNLTAIDYPKFCGIEQVKSIDAATYAREYKRQSNHILLDVRTEAEYAVENIGGINIPLDELDRRLNEVDEEELTIVMCKSGMRSHTAATLLQSSGRNVVQLDGGLTAWKKYLLTSRKMQ